MQAVEPAVVIRAELDDLDPAGRGARHAQGELDRLGPGADETRLLGRGHTIGDQLRQPRLAAMDARGSQPVAHLVPDGGEDGRRRMPQDQRPVTERVVDEAIAVDIDDMGALAPLDRDRHGALRRARRGGDAEGEMRQRLLAVRVRTGEALAVCGVKALSHYPSLIGSEIAL
ncbi:hypothetical protein BOSEA31B_12895 [Hyphomicrobiales bacterium]|nr:hypothetical protein BOSEA31B_12895 [Hyphomicrobiales bacterium]CAH1698669.1 hypothetical protein BOSEA1005_11722 [Hyphomicrobiales bacterium]CAI0342314.1 hypothetical protein BO1005MUT1_180093 [Hyphomicrobiales bacterium]